MKATWCLALAALFLVAPALAQEDVDPAKIWADPEFKKMFLGTYGIHPDIEPRVGPEERTVLEEVYPLLSTDQNAAVARLQAELAKPETTALFDFILGNVAFQKDQVAEAAAHYQKAVAKFPNFRRGWKNLGLTRAREQDYDGAIKSFTRMIELGGGDAISYGLLGFAYASKNDFLAAEAAYRNALLLDPQNTEWRLGLARSVVRQEKYEEAAALLKVLIERFPERSEFWLLQANAYLGMKQPLRAAENFEVVARMDKATPETMYVLGDIYTNEGLYDPAVAAYLRGIELKPDQSPARVMRAVEALAGRGAQTQARQVAQRVEEAMGSGLSAEDRRKLLKLEARIAAAEGEGNEAAKVLEEVVILDPLDGEALVALGQHYSRAGDAPRAMVYFERAANIPQFEAGAKVRMAQILVGQEKYSEALALLKRAQEIKPQAEVARYLEQVERMARQQ